MLHIYTIDYIIIAAYFVIILSFGAYFGKYAKTTSDFFFGGRRFHWWLICMSIVATGVSSHSFIKYSAMGFKYGLSSSMAYMNDWFFMPLFMFGWLPIVYYTRVNSIPQYFENRFNPMARKLATVVQIIYMLGYISIGFLTLGVALKNIIGLSLYPTVLIVAAVVAFYVRIGGEICDVFLDLIQGIMLTVAGIILFLLGIAFIGGFEQFWNSVPAWARLPLADFNEPADFNFVGIFWQDGVAGSIGFLFLNQGLIMRFLSCKSVNEGRKAAAVNVLIFLPISAIVVSNAGWIAKAISITHPELIPPNFTPLDDIFVKVNFLVGHPGISGFIAAALIAALLSTVDSLINATTAIFIFDVFKPMHKKEKPDSFYLKSARWTTLAVTAIAVGLVPLFHSFGTIYKAHGWFHSTVIPPLVAAVFLGILWPRYSAKAAIWTFIGGGGMIILGQIFPQLVTPFAHGTPHVGNEPYIFIGALYNLIACFGIGIIVTFFTQRKNPQEIDGLTIWTIKSSKKIYKGGAEPNEIPGKRIFVNWKKYSVDETSAAFSHTDLLSMNANPGDLVYLCDKRWWLGGLKSVHAKISAPHNDTGIVYLGDTLIKSGLFTEGKILYAEKEL